jgi:hypothetical protein
MGRPLGYNAQSFRGPLANKKRSVLSSAMEVRSCCVTISDTEGVAHSIEVAAVTLYEAVALGSATSRRAIGPRASLKG